MERERAREGKWRVSYCIICSLLSMLLKNRIVETVQENVFAWHVPQQADWLLIKKTTHSLSFVSALQQMSGLVVLQVADAGISTTTQQQPDQFLLKGASM